MKPHKIFAIALLLLIATSCSSEDNYSAPNQTLKGAIYDLATKGDAEEKMIPAQSPDGARIKLYEGSSTQAQIVWCRSDGSFTNTRLFADEYKLVPEGPFVVDETDIITTFIPTKENIKFYLEPYLRVELKGDLNREAKEVKFSFKINKSEQWSGRLNQFVVLYSTTSHVSVSAYTDRITTTIPANDESKFLNKELEATISNIDPTKPIFIRIAAKSTGTDYFNYSEVVEVK